MLSVFFFFNDTAPPEISPLSLPDALPICHGTPAPHRLRAIDRGGARRRDEPRRRSRRPREGRRLRRRGSSDRKSTRLNSSHLVISYAVFCLKKKKTSIAARTMQHSSAMFD